MHIAHFVPVCFNDSCFFLCHGSFMDYHCTYIYIGHKIPRKILVTFENDGFIIRNSTTFVSPFDDESTRQD